MASPIHIARPSDPCLFRLHADSFVCGANLKLRQANARAQAKVARARARVYRGLATPLFTAKPQHRPCGCTETAVHSMT